jgi:ProP effector
MTVTATTEAEATVTVLAETFPECFRVLGIRRRPIKIGIDQDIAARLAGAVTPEALVQGLRYYCNSIDYLEHMIKGTWRVDLDGNAVGEVTAEEELHSKEKIAARKAGRARRKAEIERANAPKKLSLSDLKEAAQRRRQALEEAGA